ncbi:DsbA family oxidoreductase [Funiculus sociatus]|uniref:DsbA family oxidoreductase n=1 Tax=Funiculus sociatus TaxID=450527 RepID=UPI003299E0CC
MLIEIFHDTACPWCYIGTKHLFDALEKWQYEAIKIQWHPFLLDDTIPPQGVEFRAFMKERKGMEPEELKRLFDYTKQRGETSGVKLDFNKISLAVNTTLSHQMIALSPTKSKNAVVEAIYKAYFEEGLNIGDIETLVSVGKAAGIDATQLRSLLSSDAALDEVMADATSARRSGINSVPFFIFNNKINVNGSQSVEVFLQTLERAALPETLKVNSLW